LCQPSGASRGSSSRPRTPRTSLSRTGAAPPTLGTTRPRRIGSPTRARTDWRRAATGVQHAYMPQVDRTSDAPPPPASARDRVHRHLKERILSGELAGGEMTSEGEIAAALGVSRTPVREALLR